MPLKMVVVVKKQRKRVGHIDKHYSNQQPCCGQCPVALEIVWYTHAKGPRGKVIEAAHVTTFPLSLAFSCHISWKLLYCW